METQIHVPVGSPVIRKIHVFVDELNVTEGALELIKELRPTWDISSVKTKLFTDGTTNKLVGCSVDACPEDVVLVRVYGNKTELIVDRDNELKSFQVLHANGCAPRLYCTFQNGICYEFMQGDALGPQDVRDPTLIWLIAREMARIHAIHAHNGCIPKPNLWIKMRKYFSLVATEFTEQASNIRIQQEVPSKAVLEQEMLWMKEHLSTLGSPVVLCHNDLLCKNIIHNSKEGGWCPEPPWLTKTNLVKKLFCMKLMKVQGLRTRENGIKQFTSCFCSCVSKLCNKTPSNTFS
uniref:ethanolamine kinase n=1 Tax=Nothobranchius furzeri TaxID=105023 RepID=A0A8C6PD33_NOTFU